MSLYDDVLNVLCEFRPEGVEPEAYPAVVRLIGELGLGITLFA